MTTDSLVVTWKPVTKRLNGILKAYIIRWKAVNSGQNYTTLTLKISENLSETSSSARKRRDTHDLPASDETSFKLTNLTLYTNYSVQVAAFTIKDGPYSDPVYILSGEGGKMIVIDIKFLVSLTIDYEAERLGENGKSSVTDL